MKVILGTRGFKFRDNYHQPGARIILGKSYADNGEAQGRGGTPRFSPPSERLQNLFLISLLSI